MPYEKMQRFVTDIIISLSMVDSSPFTAYTFWQNSYISLDTLATAWQDGMGGRYSMGKCYYCSFLKIEPCIIVITLLSCLMATYGTFWMHRSPYLIISLNNSNKNGYNFLIFSSIFVFQVSFLSALTSACSTGGYMLFCSRILA